MTETKLKQYFLENLPSQEVEEIELRIISDVNFAPALETAETDLIEDYLEGTLSADETKLFETKYLITEERREQVKFLKTLKQYAQNATRQIETEAPTPGFFEKLKAFFTPSKLAFAAGLVVLAILLGIIWKVFLPIGNLDSELVAMNQKDLSNPAEFKDLTKLELIAGKSRGDGNSDGLVANNLSENVFFRLALLTKLPTDSTFQVNFLRERKVIFSLDKIRLYQNGTAQEFRLLVPAKLLEKGDYQIELQKENSNESKIIYNFTVR